MCVFNDLPAGVQLVVCDYLGERIIKRHRDHGHVLFELECLSLIHGERLRPAVVPCIKRLKQTLELAYLQAQMKSRAERGIP